MFLPSYFPFFAFLLSIEGSCFKIFGVLISSSLIISLIIIIFYFFKSVLFSLDSL